MNRFTFFAICVAALSISTPGQTRDGYGDRPLVCNPVDIPDAARLKRCQEWIASVKQPDNDNICCAESDAYITDDFVVRNGQLFAITTVEYPGLPKGTRIPIPNNKINNAAKDGGNPSGHSTTFAAMENVGSNPTFLVYCYLGGTLG